MRFAKTRIVLSGWVGLLAVGLVSHAHAEPVLAADTPAAEVATSLRAEPEPGVVNINSASAEELERLPGIGPTRARAILALRARLTRFTRLEELLRVKGIGRATFRKLRPYLALDGPTNLSR
ncbi:MAG: helix-hairpin-helix domain-containing protein [Polyangiales bacterium]